MPEAESETVRRFADALREGMRKHEEFVRLNTRPATSAELHQFHAFLSSYWTYRWTTLIDLRYTQTYPFTADDIDWELPDEITHRTVSGQPLRKTEKWTEFYKDWIKFRNECEDRRWQKELEKIRQEEEQKRAAEYGKLLGRYFRAEARAYELLLSCLTQEQRESFWYRGFFLVTTPDGERFKIENKDHSNVVALDEGEQRYCGVCSAPEGGLVPKSDSILAQKLTLETDPNRLLIVSNRIDEI